jgi:hypothetical protein
MFIPRQKFEPSTRVAVSLKESSIQAAFWGGRFDRVNPILAL